MTSETCRLTGAVTAAGGRVGHVTLHTMYHFFREVARPATEVSTGKFPDSPYGATSNEIYTGEALLLGLIGCWSITLIYGQHHHQLWARPGSR